MRPINTRQYGRMPVEIYDSNQAMGSAAARDLAEILRRTVAQQQLASLIVATGNSQLTFFEALRRERGVPWSRITVFHMDEYLGMSAEHPASFRRFIREKLTDVVGPRAFYGITGDTEDVEAELDRYASLLRNHEPIACVLGFGENGHLAFNDPPADFDTDRTIQVVTLAESARRQQVGEGHFCTLDEVPKRAITLTVPALLERPHILAVVPEKRKARAVREALEGPVTRDCPASVLRTVDHVRLYLDRDSSSLLDQLS